MKSLNQQKRLSGGPFKSQKKYLAAYIKSKRESYKAVACKKQQKEKEDEIWEKSW